jgi:thiol-disulfide isomerase/thioredoxin
MNKFAVAVALTLCSAGVGLGQSCENGVCRLNSVAPHESAGQPVLPEYNGGFKNAGRRYLNSSATPIGTGTASVCTEGRCHGFDCEGHDRSETGYRVRDGRFQAPGPRGANYETPIRPRTNSGAGFRDSNQRTELQWPAERSYRPVAYTAATVNWNSNLREAAAMAKQSGRPMLIKVSAEWCGYCQQMKRETFADSRVVRDIRRNFVAVDLDADTNESIVKQLRITSLPTVLIVSPDLRILAREEGFRTAVQVGKLMHRHMQRAQLETGLKVASR